MVDNVWIQRDGTFFRTSDVTPKAYVYDRVAKKEYDIESLFLGGAVGLYTIEDVFRSSYIVFGDNGPYLSMEQKSTISQLGYNNVIFKYYKDGSTTIPAIRFYDGNVALRYGNISFPIEDIQLKEGN